MNGELVAVDVETTGLDADVDAIIEIGLVRFKEGEILDTYETLIRPSVPIPDRVTAITGLQDEDVANAPTFKAVLPTIRDFIGNTTILGHNVHFDKAFLRSHGLPLHNSTIDTYELASVLLPTAARYSLVSLVEELGIESLNNAHRGLADAEATCQLYWILWKKLLELPLKTLQEIVDLSSGIDWNARLAFETAYDMRVQQGLYERRNRIAVERPFEKDHFSEHAVLYVNETLEKLDIDEIAAIIEPEGILSQAIPNYESRESQVKMLRKITQSFNEHQHSIIEAPTGTGKSIAYLIPAIYWSIKNNERVVISTATITLQEQLIKKDIPMLRKSLGADFKAVVLKGRGNYLCPRRLHTLRRRSPTSVEELRLLSKILVWLLEDVSGDRGEISLRGGAEDMTWVRLSAEDEGCTLDRCEAQMGGGCPFYKARRRAEAAHIVIVNHSLLLSDVVVSDGGGGRVLPDYRYVVIDEAHHLESATTNGLSTQIDRYGLQRRFADLGSMESGLLGDLLANLKDKISENHFSKLKNYVELVVDNIKKMGRLVDNYFHHLLTFLQQQIDSDRFDYMIYFRITAETRQNSGWAQIQNQWQNLSRYTEVIANAMGQIADALNKINDEKINEFSDILSSVQTAATHLKEIQQQMEAFNLHPSDNIIYWCEISQDWQQLSIKTAPLHIGYLIEKHLWKSKESVILTSATMSTNNSFDFIRERLNAERNLVRDFAVNSPFDYKNSTLIYIPTDIQEPTVKDQYQLAVERAIIEMATALNGRTMGLFTSYTHLRQTAQNIAPRLRLGGITVYDQTSGSSRQLLIDSFKSSEKAVLLGTRSFWEGVDLPGEELYGLVITRLPFSVPSDPIFAARSETFENSFMQYAVPEAILLFRQGFGRLIRRRTDRGVVVILDKRIISKRYGQAFLDSLPDCTVYKGPLARLGELTKRWLKL